MIGWVLSSLVFSEVSVEFTLAAPVNGAYHVAKLAHAHVHAAGISEQAVVELGFVGFGVLGGVTDGLTILVFGVAAPHRINWFLAS